MRRIVLLLVAFTALSGCQTVSSVTDAVVSATDSVTRSVGGLFASGNGTETHSKEETARSNPEPVLASTGQSATPIPAAVKPVASNSLPAPDGSSERSGSISADAVIDGDTMALGGRRIRLHGIDAPELSQTCSEGGKATPCGEVARNALIGFTAGSAITCQPKDTDRYGREVAVCRTGDTDINALMVRSGMAVAYREYSGDYVSDENMAKALQRGMWRGTFEMPWDWRAKKRQ